MGASVTLEPGDTYAPALFAKPLLSNLYNKLFSSDNSAVITVDGETLKALTAGTANITASATYRGQTYQDSSEVTVADLEYDLTSSRTATDITLARVPESIEVGEEFAAQAYILSAVTEEHPYPYGYSDDNLVKFTSSTPSVCRVKNGVLEGITPGTATITVSDLTGAVTKTFQVEVVAETALEYTEDQVQTVNAGDYDWTDAETTTLAIQSILTAAADAGMRKVIFPEQIYEISPEYGSIYVPTNMILDFSGSVIQVVENSMTSTSYTMIYFQDTEYSSIVNATIYGERDLSGGGYGTLVRFTGHNYRSGLENCTIGKASWGGAGTGRTGLVRVGFKLANVEAGGIDDNGANKEETYAFRNNGYMDIAKVGERFGFGNMQGYQGYAYLGARCYDIFFYDESYVFLSCLKNCLQYYLYDKPQGARYARIVFRQASAPTGSDPDFASIAHIYSYNYPKRCYIRNCHFFECNDLAISPQGGDSFCIENCSFADNGYSDPASHIDWEDGRNHSKGHILKGCTFDTGGATGAVRVLGADGVVIHGNTFNGVPLKIGSEAQNSRIWLNNFIGDGADLTITPKTDEVVSQNQFYDSASYTINTVDGVDFAVRETANNVQ